jgi:hypothetical protein
MMESPMARGKIIPKGTVGNKKEAQRKQQHKA